ncbi:hypothetical protein [Pontiella desulfatans]|nr:hypothetical protein [Pontiella desulfatans]
MKLFQAFICLAVIALGGASAHSEEAIDRKAVVSRHHIIDPPIDMPLPLGNGEFCFGVDATGLQTLDGNSFSHWGKHTAPLPPGVTEKDIPETGTFDRGRIKGHMVTPKEKGMVWRWMSDNPWPVHLGRLRFIDAEGKVLASEHIKNPKRKLDVWQGIQVASFMYEGVEVKVETLGLSDQDGVAVRVQSELLREGKMGVELDFPIADGKRRYKAEGGPCEVHKTMMTVTGNELSFERQMDNDIYKGGWRICEGTASFNAYPEERKARLIPRDGDVLSFVCLFGQTQPGSASYTDFDVTKKQTADFWETFWMSGGAIDLSLSKDSRWKELERRLVLSQYLMRTNNAGSLPTAEYGLMAFGGWAGQFHMEMAWWHMAHYGVWDRWHLAEEALTMYQRFLPIARKRAAQLDYKGAKWGKQNSPDGRMKPWDGNLGLSWQQPHPIFFAEQEYRLNPDIKTLDKWNEVVFATAEYMASFPVKDEEGRYKLEFVVTANENGICHNPAFESAYWRWGLNKAQEWRKRLGMKPEKSWQEVSDNLVPLTLEKNPKTGEQVFAWCEEWVWTNPKNRTDYGHPDQIGGFSFVPFVDGVSPQIAANTVRHINDSWVWTRCWGWDFPWAAMAAARTEQPELAVELLLKDNPRNHYSERGINGDWYLPGNGGVLYAVAMMAAGWDGAPERHAPGFPDNGQWKVRWEGLKRAQ